MRIRNKKKDSKVKDNYRDIEGWVYPFDTLPHWDHHGRFANVEDKLYENPYADMACLLYSIVEASMCNYIGFLAILENKASPVLSLNLTELEFPWNEIFFSKDGQLIFVKARAYNRQKNKMHFFFLVINLKKAIFAYQKISSGNECYSWEETRPGKFRIVVDAYQAAYDQTLQTLDGMVVDTDEMEWFPIKEIHQLHCRIYANE